MRRTRRPLTAFCVVASGQAWWTNILYISNLVPGQLTEIGHMKSPNGEAELGCYIQTWYLSNDFQLCLLTPLIAILYKKSKKVAYVFLAFVLAAMVRLTLAARACLCDN